MNSETTLDRHAPEGQTRTLHFLTILISKWSPTRTNQPANKPPKPNKRTKLEWLLSLSNTYLPSTGRAVVSIQEFHGAAHHNTMWWFKFSERRMQWRPQEDTAMKSELSHQGRLDLFRQWGWRVARESHLIRKSTGKTQKGGGKGQGRVSAS